jgi:hypothetical protein
MYPANSAIRHPAFFNRYVEQVVAGKISDLLETSVNLLEQDLQIISKSRRHIYLCTRQMEHQYPDKALH